MNNKKIGCRKLMMAILVGIGTSGYSQVKIPGHTKNVVKRMERKAERKTEKEATKKMDKGIEKGFNGKKEEEIKVDSTKKSK